MKKIIAVAVALLAALTLSLSGTGSAFAASNGDHDQGFSCTTSGSSGVDFTSVFSYHVTGVGTSAENRLYPDRFAYHTDPSALLNRVDLALSQGPSSPSSFWVMQLGGSSSTLDDVPASGTILWPSGTYFTWPNGGDAILRLQASGGVGKSTGGCSVSHATL